MAPRPIFAATHPRAISTAFERVRFFFFFDNTKLAALSGPVVTKLFRLTLVSTPPGFHDPS